MSNGGNPLETELNTYRTIQKEIGKVQGNISTAQTQILENELVLKVHWPSWTALRRAAAHRRLIHRSLACCRRLVLAAPAARTSTR